MKEIVYEMLYTQELNHWWYRVRRNLVKRIVHDDYVEKKRRLKILDVGCGAGALMKELEGYGAVSGVDFSIDSVNFCKKRGITDVRQGDILNLPFQDNTFDIVLALDILEHVDDDKKGASEISRVLKSGGKAIVFVPSFMILWGSTDEVSKHKRRYRKTKFLQTLEQGSLEVKKSTYFNFFLFIPILLVRLISRFFNRSLTDEYKPGSGFLNELFYRVFNMEIFFIKHISFPFGVSIMAICKKNV